MPTKKTILIINYYWPPCGGPAVQRWLDFANRMVMDNFNMHVLTVSNHTATFTSSDLSLVKEIHHDIKVHNADANDFFWAYKKFLGKGKVPGNALADETKPGFLKKMARFIRGNFFLPDPRRGWNRNAEKKALELIGQYNVDTIITAGPPQSTHLIGLAIKRRISTIFWIADLHDYWTDVFFLDKFYRTTIANWIDKRYEKEVLSCADKVLTHTEYGKKLYLTKVSALRDSNFIHIVRMGFDEKKLLGNRLAISNNEIFKVIYTGTMADYYHPESVLYVLNEIILENKGAQFELHFVGIIAPKIIEYIKSLNLYRHTRFHGYLPHADSIKQLLSANLLLLFNPDVKNDLGVVPGKIFEYMATGIPILSISNHGSENEIILKSINAGENFERNEKELIKKHILKIIKSKDEFKYNIPLIYSRENQYLILKEILD